MTLVETEQVLVVPTERFHALGYFQGFSDDVERYLDQLLDAEHVSYRPRNEMEEDPSFKQLIPYVVLRHTDANGAVQVFQYTRGDGQGERRLHSKRSVGVGGHISSIDADSGNGGSAAPVDPYLQGMHRELDEEIVIETGYRERLAGLINDDETEVGRVHLGVVHVFDVDTPEARPRESEILEAGFRPVSELLNHLDEFESWSQICLTALFGKQR